MCPELMLFKPIGFWAHLIPSHTLALSIKICAFKLNNSLHNIMPYINLTTDCHIAIVSIVHCWEVVKKDIAGQDGKSGDFLLFTDTNLNVSQTI